VLTERHITSLLFSITQILSKMSKAEFKTGE